MSDIRFLGLTLAGHSRNTARLPIRPLKKEPTEHQLIFVPKDGAIDPLGRFRSVNRRWIRQRYNRLIEQMLVYNPEGVKASVAFFACRLNARRHPVQSMIYRTPRRHSPESPR